MKKFIIVAIMLFNVSMSINAQVVRSGNTFKSTSTRSGGTKADTLVTQFKFEDSKGNTYPIIVNKTSGACYVWKKSGKTGKMYKNYMKPEITQAVCKELNIAYTPKKK